MKSIVLILALYCLIAVCTAGAEDVPRLLNYQGRLTNTLGAPLDTNVSMIFSIYADTSGGAAKWTETHSTVSVSKGLFNVLLGSTNQIPDSVFRYGERYLGIKVGTDPEIRPRTRLVSTPYSFRSASVTGFSPGPHNVDSGAYNFIAGDSNIIIGDYSSIIGGNGNRVELLYDKEPGSKLFENAALAGGISCFAKGEASAVVWGQFNITWGKISFIGGGYANITGTSVPPHDGKYATIGGGAYNKAIGDYTTIAGGDSNMIASTGKYGAICGGFDNQVTGQNGFIGGGEYNSAQGIFSAIAGGGGNKTFSEGSFIGGGVTNVANGLGSTISGGVDNITGSGANCAAICGGIYNKANGMNSAITGGRANHADGQDAFIGGGDSNYVLGGAGFGTIGGGYLNEIQSLHSTIGGGWQNIIEPYGDCGTIGGGYENRVSDSGGTIAGGRLNLVQNCDAFVGGGYHCWATNMFATVGGGYCNTASGFGSTVAGGLSDTASYYYGAVGGGQHNRASGYGAAVPGGENNTAEGPWSTACGGYGNDAAGKYSLAAGYKAKAIHNGAFVWSDSCEDAGFSSISNNTFNVRACGGIYFLINNSGWFKFYDDGTNVITTLTGAHLTKSGQWVNNSDVNMKENFAQIDANLVLENLLKLKIYQYNFKCDDDSITHIGPTAQDFYALFGLGNDHKTISSLDPSGIALAAIQELYKTQKELEMKTDKIQELESEVQELRAIVNQILEKSK